MLTQTAGAPYVLRRSVAPIMAFAIPMPLVTILAAYACYVSKAWHSLIYTLLPWLPLLPWIYLQQRYKVSFTPTTVVREAAGLEPLSIDFDAIEKVKVKTRSVGEGLSIARPFRRISIYAPRKGGEDDFIDVSLKHFLRADIVALVRAIRARRPDLELPRHWI